MRELENALERAVALSQSDIIVPEDLPPSLTAPPIWRVDADNPARAALLGAAARDALVRATAYADALGLRLGEVELISEVPLVPEPSPQPRTMMAAAKMADSVELSVSSGTVELNAEVYVRFAILR